MKTPSALMLATLLGLFAANPPHAQRAEAGGASEPAIDPDPRIRYEYGPMLQVDERHYASRPAPPGQL